MTWPKDAEGNKTEYVGTFVESRMEGQGKLTVTKENGATETYEGEFLENKKHGKGEVCFSDRPDENYTGEFENGRLIGEKQYSAPKPADGPSPLTGKKKLFAKLSLGINEKISNSEDFKAQMAAKGGKKS